MRVRHAFSLTELLTVLAILMILFAIALPVTRSVLYASSEAQCMSNLKQIHLALAMYRTDHGGDGVYGHPSAMGLPTWMGKVGIYHKVWECRGRRIEGKPVYAQMWPPPETIWRYGKVGEQIFDKWIRYAEAEGEEAVIVIDENHQLELPTSKFSLQKAIGLRLGGSVRKRLKRGECTRLEWWQDEARER